MLQRGCSDRQRAFRRLTASACEPFSLSLPSRIYLPTRQVCFLPQYSTFRSQLTDNLLVVNAYHQPGRTFFFQLTNDSVRAAEKKFERHLPTPLHLLAKVWPARRTQRRDNGGEKRETRFWKRVSTPLRSPEHGGSECRAGRKTGVSVKRTSGQLERCRRHAWTEGWSGSEAGRSLSTRFSHLLDLATTSR